MIIGEKRANTFNPLPSHEGRLNSTGLSCNGVTFNPLPSHEGRRGRLRVDFLQLCLSIHFPLTREDTSFFLCHFLKGAFQSTSLSRGKTAAGLNQGGRELFQSTSLSRGKTSHSICCNLNHSLSIHFPLTREDSKKR